MKDRSVIKAISRKFSDFSTKIIQDGRTFYFITESIKKSPPTIRTSVYLDGTHLKTIKKELQTDDVDGLKRIMETQHMDVINEVKKNLIDRKKINHVEEIDVLIKRGRLQDAIEVAMNAMAGSPDEPYLMSYYGYLLAATGKDTVEGIRICKEAIRVINRTVHFGVEFLYPVYYLNLGRALLFAGMKKEAVYSFRRGLTADTANEEIIAELLRLGIRKKPVIPFISRKNPINKYLGIILSRLKLRESGRTPASKDRVV